MTTTVGNRQSLREGIRKGWSTYWTLMKVMVPVYIGVAILQHTPVMPAVARFFSPAMAYWHLPGDAALAMVAGHFVNLYAAVAVIAAGHWDPSSVTIAGVILGVSHNHFIEGAIFRQMRAPAMALIALRITIGWTLGWLIAQWIGI